VVKDAAESESGTDESPAESLDVQPKAELAYGATPSDSEPATRVEDQPEADEAEVGAEPAALILEEVGDLSLSQFESVWPALVAGVRDELGPRRQALFREASPGSVEGSTVTLHLPAHLSFHLEQLQTDEMVKEVVEARAAELLGGSIRIQFRSGTRTESGAGTLPDESDQTLDKHQLLEAPSGPTDPDALVEGLLGGQMIEEVVTDD
jgi:hypothetical protein